MVIFSSPGFYKIKPSIQLVLGTTWMGMDYQVRHVYLYNCTQSPAFYIIVTFKTWSFSAIIYDSIGISLNPNLIKIYCNESKTETSTQLFHTFLLPDMNTRTSHLRMELTMCSFLIILSTINYLIDVHFSTFTI